MDDKIKVCSVCMKTKLIKHFTNELGIITKRCDICKARQKRYIKAMNDRRAYAKSLRNKIYESRIIIYI